MTTERRGKKKEENTVRILPAPMRPMGRTSEPIRVGAGGGEGGPGVLFGGLSLEFTAVGTRKSAPPEPLRGSAKILTRKKPDHVR